MSAGDRGGPPPRAGVPLSFPSPAPTPTPALPRRRASLLLVATLIGLLGLGFRLGVVQGVQSEEYGGLARQQRTRELTLPPVRGTIYDRDGRELALSVPARTVYANPKQLDDPEGVARVLEPILGIPAAEMLPKLSNRERGFVYLARRVDLEVAGEIAALDLTGIGMLDEARRTYPGKSLAANVLGFVGTDADGLSGLEYAYEKLLGGTPGVRVLEQDPLGRRIPQGVFHEEPPIAGSDLILTIDQDIQHAADRVLAKAVEEYSADAGSVVVMDPRSGEILAMSNHPTYDPNDLSTLSEGVTRNRAVTDAYEPGSVSKVVTAAAAIETGTVTPETTFSVPAKFFYAGRYFSDSHGHPTMTMPFKEIIAESSNVGTIKVALEVGADAQYEYMKRFGYGRATALGFPGESSGILPRTDRWKTSLPTMAIGQGVSGTLLQLARIFATVANDGVAVEPHLVSGWVDPDGTVHRTPDASRERVIGVDTARQVREMLTGVVRPGGTATRATIPGYEVAGKTGTAQKPSPSGGYSGHQATFVGMLPADAPQVVVAVTLDQPSPIWAGVVAAPLFAEVGQAAARILRIAPTIADLPPGGAELASDAPASPELAAGGEGADAAGRVLR